MKALRTLLRIAESDLETLRRALADQLSKQALIEQRVLAHAEMVRAEQTLAMRDAESARAFSGYAMAALATRRGLEGECQSIVQECERLRALITEAHVEARKFERLIELDEQRARKAAEKREDAELDEIATLRAGRAGRA